MLKMKADTPMKTAAEAAADGMRDALAGLKKPAALELAERNLTATRAKRAEAATEQFDRIREFNRKSPSATLPSPEIKAGEAALAKHDDAIKAARTKLAEARQSFQPTFLAELAGPMKDIAAEIAAHVTEIEQLTGALAEARRFAERNAVEPPRLLGGTYALRECTAAIRRTIGR